MKKVLALLIVLLLTVALVGCENTFPYGKHETYTKDEVDELIQNAINELQQQNTDLWKALNDRYVQMEIGDDNLYFNCYLDGMVKVCESVNYQEQIDELELIIDNLEEIIFENQRRLDNELDIEIMYGEYAGRDGDYILVNVNDDVYTTSHISDETIYWGSNMIVIRIGDIYLSYVNRGD